jgi:hypothetical protein
VNFAAYLIALFAIAAIIQAILPIEHWDLWTGWRRFLFVLLDVGVFLIAVAVVILLRAVTAGPVGALEELWERLQDPPLFFALFTAIGILVFLTTLESAPSPPATGSPLIQRLVVVVLGIGILAVLAYALIEDRNIRTVVVGTIAAFVLFQVLSRVGTWRWSEWDEAERVPARRRGTPIRRLGIWLTYLALAVPATLVGFAIAVGEPTWVAAAGAVLLALVVVFLIADVVVRET